LFGRSDGFNAGKGGSMHIADFSVGMLGANGVVAAGLPIACGAAHALKLQRKPQVVACFFGDGATNRGPFLEALNWAAVYELPVLFVCEDNRFSATTPTRQLTAGPGALARAESLGVPGLAVDGNDVAAVFEATASLIAQVRRGAPRFLHALTWRVRGHVSVDVQGYRDPADLQGAVDADPLLRARAQALEAGVDPAALDALDASAQAEADQAVAFANASPWPDAASAYSDVQTFGAGPWR
jgi:pyruvate dehydrogenase E1 component alpha subunit